MFRNILISVLVLVVSGAAMVSVANADHGQRGHSGGFGFGGNVHWGRSTPAFHGHYRPDYVLVTPPPPVFVAPRPVYVARPSLGAMAIQGGVALGMTAMQSYGRPAVSNKVIITDNSVKVNGDVVNSNVNSGVATQNTQALPSGLPQGEIVDYREHKHGDNAGQPDWVKVRLASGEVVKYEWKDGQWKKD